MKCKYAETVITEKCGDRMIPLSVRFHILNCPSCAAKARMMEDALSVSRKAFIVEAPDLSSSIMNSIRNTLPEERIPVSFRNWILVGLTLLGAITISPFTDTFAWAKKAFGVGFQVPINIVLSIMLVVYCSFFIFSHLEILIKRLKLR